MRQSSGQQVTLMAASNWQLATMSPRTPTRLCVRGPTMALAVARRPPRGPRLTCLKLVCGRIISGSTEISFLSFDGGVDS